MRPMAVTPLMIWPINWPVSGLVWPVFDSKVKRVGWCDICIKPPKMVVSPIIPRVAIPSVYVVYFNVNVVVSINISEMSIASGEHQ